MFSTSFRFFTAILVMLFSQINVFAQKIDIDKKPVITRLIALPSKPVDTSWHTFSYTFKGENNLASWSIDVDQAKATYFKLSGYNTVEKGGDLHLEATLQPVRIVGSDVTKRSESSKDKSGRVTTTNYYRYVVSYESGLSWKLFDKNGKELTPKAPGAGFGLVVGSNIKKKEGSEYGTYKEAYDSYYNNRAQITRDIAVAELESLLGGMYETVNSHYGYVPYKTRFNIWLLDTKGHPEQDALTQHYQNVKTVFESISAYQLTQDNIDALKPSIEYYESIPQKYQADEKADRKLRYAAFFNLSNIYLHLDNPTKAIEYANLLIQNDYDKGDGKDFVKDAGKLKELLASKQTASRRFSRKAEILEP